LGRDNKLESNKDRLQGGDQVSLIDALIAQGMKNNAEFTKELIEIKKRVENTKEKQAIASLENVTGVMQEVDDFTLTESANTKQSTTQMQEVDDFTLQEVMKQDERITALETKINGNGVTV
jgi:propanediol dehydratase small subunit